MNEMLPSAELLSYVTIAQSQVHDLLRLFVTKSSLEYAGANAKDILDIMDREPLVPLEGGMELPECKGEFIFENVSFAYPTAPKAHIVKGVSFCCRAGQTTAIVAHAGFGKSTMFKLVQRLYDPSEGRILLDGVDLKDLNPSWLRRHMGVVPQKPILFNTTVLENIRYAVPDASIEQVWEAAEAANIAETIRSEKWAKYGGLFMECGETQKSKPSGGEAQRIAIARNLLKNPKILLLDEATSSLDNEAELAVQKAIDKLCKDRTVLVIAHRLTTIRDANTIAFFSKDSKVNPIEQGTHAELARNFPNGEFMKLWNLQGQTSMQGTEADTEDHLGSTKGQPAAESKADALERTPASVGPHVSTHGNSILSGKVQSIMAKLQADDAITEEEYQILSGVSHQATVATAQLEVLQGRVEQLTENVANLKSKNHNLKGLMRNNGFSMHPDKAPKDKAPTTGMAKSERGHLVGMLQKTRSMPTSNCEAPNMFQRTGSL